MAVLSLNTLIEKAARRAGHLPEVLTTEQQEFIKENLYLLLSHYATYGLNLWRVKKLRMGINSGQKVYTFPQVYSDGTSDGSVVEHLLTINYAQAVNQLPYTGSMTGTNFQADTPGILQNVGVKPATAATFMVQLSTDNGTTWTTQMSFSAPAGAWTYVDLNIQVNGLWRLSSAVSVTLTSINFVSLVSEIPMAPLNRDDYWNLPNKEFQADRPLQYWFDRQISPQISLWPVGNDETVSVNMLVCTQIADINRLTLSDSIDLPQRWYPAVLARLAAEAAAELPGVDQNKLLYLEKKAETLEREANDEENDDLPIYFAPNISHYTS